MWPKKKAKKVNNLSLADIDPIMAQILNPLPQLREKYAIQKTFIRQQISVLECAPPDRSFSKEKVLGILREWLNDTETIEYLLQDEEVKAKSRREVTVFTYK